MGEFQSNLFSLSCNRSVRVEARPERLSADAGVLLLRELTDRLGYPALFRKHLDDPRDAARITHPQGELLRTAVLLLAGGWSDHTDATLLRDDPALRLAVSERRGQRPLREAAGREPDGLCSQPTLSRLLASLGSEANLAGLREILLDAAERRMQLSAGKLLPEITLDLDSVPVEVYGHQPGSGYNSHYRMRCYHPLVVRSEQGDFLGATLRPGKAGTANGGTEFVKPVLGRAKTWADQVWLRMDAGFPAPELLKHLEGEGIRYVARLKGNAVLARLAAPFLNRPPGRPPAEGRLWTYELRYRAGSWSRERRVVLVVLERTGAQGHLFLDHFFLLSNAEPAETDAEALLARYRQRGVAEKDFGGWKQATGAPLSSSPREKSRYRGQPVQQPYREPDSFGANHAKLLLGLIAANVLHAGAALLEREGRARMSRERFRQLVLKTAARVVLSGRRITVVIEAARAALWRCFHRGLNRAYPARGSPQAGALPVPA